MVMKAKGWEIFSDSDKKYFVNENRNFVYQSSFCFNII